MTTVVTIEVPADFQAALDKYATGGARQRVEVKRLRRQLDDAVEASQLLGAEAKARATVHDWILESDEPEPVAYRAELDKWESQIERYTKAIADIKVALTKAENDLIESRVKGSVNAEDSAAASFEYDAARTEFNRVAKIVGEHVPQVKAFSLPSATQLITGRKVNPSGVNTSTEPSTPKFSFESIEFDGKVLDALTFTGAALETKVGTAKMWVTRLVQAAGTENLTDGQKYDFRLGGEDGEKHLVTVVPITRTRGRKPKSVTETEAA